MDHLFGLLTVVGIAILITVYDVFKVIGRNKNKEEDAD